MTKLLAAFVVLVISIVATSTLLAQDFDSGQQAYEAGLRALGSEDYATALKIWTPLAEQGNPRAQRMLGVMYDMGRGVTQDYAQAVKWYRKAAEQGNASAQNYLGRAYAKVDFIVKCNGLKQI